MLQFVEAAKLSWNSMVYFEDLQKFCKESLVNS